MLDVSGDQNRPGGGCDLEEAHVVRIRQSGIERQGGDRFLFDSTGQHRVGPPDEAWEPLDRLAIEVEQWASGLVAQAVTDGDWTRP